MLKLISCLASDRGIHYFLDRIRETIITNSRQTRSPQNLRAALAQIRSDSETRLSRLGQNSDREFRLKKRIDQTPAIEEFFASGSGRTYLGMLGWGNNCQFKAESGIGISQYDSLVYEEDGVLKQKLIDSSWQFRALVTGSQFKIQVQAHGHHFHTNLVPAESPTADGIGQNDEGCPCCLTGLDFDEFITAMNELKHASSATGDADHRLIENAEMTAEHWGVFLGVAGPLSILGLTAAIRNIKGSWHNAKNLRRVIKGVNADIRRAESNASQDLPMLKAFKKCLKYSLFDAKWNFAIPGVVNGISSASILPSAAIKHPFTLPLLALYATAQAGRSAWEISRVWKRYIPQSAISQIPQSGTPQNLTSLQKIGAEKNNQVRQSKLRFWAVNCAGFVTFALGAVLTFCALPAIGFFGAGLGMLPVGIALLTAGALLTGIANNIWPRKFRPRNGDLGVIRTALRNPDAIIAEVGDRKAQKTELKKSRTTYFRAPWSVRFHLFRYKVGSSLPFCQERYQKKIHQIKLRWFERALRENTHSYSWKNRIKLVFAYFISAIPLTLKWEDKLDRYIKSIRKGALLTSTSKEMSGEVRRRLMDSIIDSKVAPISMPTLPNEDRELLQYWIQLGKLGIQNDVVLTYLEMGQEAERKVAHHHGHGHHHGHTHLSEEDEIRQFKSKLLDRPGFTEKNGGINFDIDAILQSESQKALFIRAIDFNLHFSYLSTLRYQQYGLIDYYWALRQISPESEGS